MATTQNSSASVESPEYSAMRVNYDKLVNILSPSIASLARTLFSKNMIPKAIMDKMRMSSIPEADKAGELLSHLMSRVELKPSVFHEFVKVLEEHDRSNRLIVEILMNSYKSYTATCSESQSQHSQSNPVHFPQTILRAIQSMLSRQSSLAEPSLGGNFLGPQVQWDDNPQFGVGGRRDVLCTVSNVPTTDNPDIVPRRSRDPLTEEERRKLEEQGVHKDMQHTDLAILSARERLDKLFNIVQILSAEKTTCGEIKSITTDLMNNSDKEGGKNIKFCKMVKFQTSLETRPHDWEVAWGILFAL